MMMMMMMMMMIVINYLLFDFLGISTTALWAGLWHLHADGKLDNWSDLFMSIKYIKI